jgi:hypothetical protein
VGASSQDCSHVIPSRCGHCREKLEADKRKSQEELEEDKAWMRDFLARERKQIQAEQGLRERQREEMRLWLEALRNSSKAEALVRRYLILCLLILLAPTDCLQRFVSCYCVSTWELGASSATLMAETTALEGARVCVGQRVCLPRPMAPINGCTVLYLQHRWG